VTDRRRARRRASASVTIAFICGFGRARSRSSAASRALRRQITAIVSDVGRVATDERNPGSASAARCAVATAGRRGSDPHDTMAT
jgi:hypothetical protein